MSLKRNRNSARIIAHPVYLRQNNEFKYLKISAQRLHEDTAYLDRPVYGELFC